MEKEMITLGALEAVLANPSPSEPFDIVVQIVDLKLVGSSNTRFTFFANDGKMKLKAMLPTSMAGEVISSKLQNLGLIHIVEYTCNNIQNQRWKSNNEEIPKRDITIADESKKTVVVSLWNDIAKKEGQELLDNVDNGPIIAVRVAKVSDFLGVSLSTTGRITLMINPDLPIAQKLHSWYDTDGKGSSMASVGSTLPGGTPRAGSSSLYSEHAFLSQINKPKESFIKLDQPMWYRTCKTCNCKVTEEIGSGYWCEGCQKHETECSLRYIMVVKASDSRGEAWISIFSDQAEKILWHTADELAVIRSEEADQKAYQIELKKAMWVPQILRVSVAQTEYMNEMRQRITVRSCIPVDWSGECKYLLEEISKMKTQA